LLACNRPPGPPREAAYAPQPAQTYGNAPYAHGDMPPPAPRPQTYGGAPYGRADVSEQEQRLVWKSSPRWATIKRNAKREADTGTAKQDAQSKLKLAQAKAAKVGVENLTGDDIDGLTPEELKQLRGY
jgi:hypothetical protein